MIRLSHLSLLPFSTPTAAILESMKLDDDKVSETESDEDNSNLAS